LETGTGTAEAGFSVFDTDPPSPRNGFMMLKTKDLLSGYFALRDFTSSGTLSWKVLATLPQLEILLGSSSSYSCTNAASRAPVSTDEVPVLEAEAGAAPDTGAEAEGAIAAFGDLATTVLLPKVSPLVDTLLMNGVNAARIASLLSGYLSDSEFTKTGTLSKKEAATLPQFGTLLASRSSYRVTKAASKDSTLLPPDTDLVVGAAATTTTAGGTDTAAIASGAFLAGVAAFTGLALPLLAGDPTDTDEEPEAEAEAERDVEPPPAPTPTPKLPKPEEVPLLKPPNVVLLRPPAADLPKPLPDEPNTEPVEAEAEPVDLLSEATLPNEA